MYIRGLIPRNFAELAEAVPIAPFEDPDHPAYPRFLIGLQWTLYNGYDQGSSVSQAKSLNSCRIVRMRGLILIISVRLCQNEPSLSERGVVDEHGGQTALNFGVKARGIWKVLSMAS